MCELPKSLGDKASYFCQIALVFTTISTPPPRPPPCPEKSFRMAICPL